MADIGSLPRISNRWWVVAFALPTEQTDFLEEKCQTKI
jgi:hypothetical protein